MGLEEDWVKGSEAVESMVMLRLPTFLVVEEQAEGRASRCRLMNRYSVGSE